MLVILFFFFKQKTAYEVRISDWSSDVCSSDLLGLVLHRLAGAVDDFGAAAEAALHAAQQEGPVVFAGGGEFQRGTGFADEGIGQVEQAIVLEIGRASCRERVCQ